MITIVPRRRRLVAFVSAVYFDNLFFLFVALTKILSYLGMSTFPWVPICATLVGRFPSRILISSPRQSKIGTRLHRARSPQQHANQHQSHTGSLPAWFSIIGRPGRREPHQQLGMLSSSKACFFLSYPFDLVA
uniref:Uncharacterized protein n=1 Tax=Opuntia streptacantha TaxID=393608 RepID=A0A7C9D1G2_OPUST